MKERIELLIKELGLSKKEFAEKAGISTGNLSDLFSGRTKMLSSVAVTTIKEKLNVDPLWLLTGDGDMFIPPEDLKERAAGEKHWNMVGKFNSNPRVGELAELLFDIDEKDYSVVEDLLRRYGKKKK